MSDTETHIVGGNNKSLRYQIWKVMNTLLEYY